MVEETVWKWIVEYLLDEERLEKGLRGLEAARESELEKFRQRESVITTLIDKKEREIRKYVALLADDNDPVIISAIKAEMKAAAKQKEELEMELLAIERQLAQTRVTEEIQAQIREIARDIRERLVEQTYDVKRSVLDMLNVQVTLYHSEIPVRLGIRCQLPTNPGHPLQGEALQSAQAGHDPRTGSIVKSLL